MGYTIPISEKDYKKYAMSSLSDLLSEYDSLDLDYENNSLILDYDAPLSLGLEKLTYDGLSDDEIYNLSKQKLEQLYSKKAENEKENTQSEKDELEKQKQLTTDSVSKLSDQIDSLYDDRLNSAENNALKRGLARSSIIMNQIENFDRERIDSKASVQSDAEKALLDIESKIGNLDTKLQKALNDFDIEYAIELNKEIQALKDERTQKQEEVIKYNNTIDEKEAKYKYELENTKQKLTNEKIDSQNSQGAYLLNQKIELAKDYFTQLEPEKAYNELINSPEMKAHLGDSYSAFERYLRQRMLDSK